MEVAPERGDIWNQMHFHHARQDWRTRGKMACPLSPQQAENPVSPGFRAALVQPGVVSPKGELRRPSGWVIPLRIFGLPPSHPRFATWQAAWRGHARRA